MNQKKIQIDVYSLLLCVQVVFIHISSEFIIYYPKDRAAYMLVFVIWKMFSFVVPAFIFISAFKIFANQNTLQLSYGTYIKNKFSRIYVPYLLWFFIYYIYFLSHGYFKIEFISLLRYLFLGNLVSHFYFVVIIFQFYLLLPFWKNIMRIKGVVLYSLIFMIIFKIYLIEIDFIYRDRVFFTYLIYWIAGCQFGRHYEQLHNYIMKHKVFITASYLLFTSYYMLGSIQQAIYGNTLKYAEYLHIIFCLISIVFVYCLTTELSKSNIIVFITQRLSPKTFQVYLSHVLFLFILNNIISVYSLTPLVKLALIPHYFLRLIHLHSFVQ
ncbi:MAG: acyltransferase [Dethiosulfatibacter sp.]|nr:acyltransferase [Dethiosulfatibacter sp.]